MHKKIAWACLLVPALVFLACSPDAPVPEMPQQRTVTDVDVDQIPAVVRQLENELGLSLENPRFGLIEEGVTEPLELQWGRIKMLRDTTGRKSYTFGVTDFGTDPYRFHNLVISQLPNGNFQRPYLLTYAMSDEFKGQYDRTGSVSGFKGAIQKRHFSSESEGFRGSANNGLPNYRSTVGEDPCDDETNVDGGEGPGGPGGGPGGGGPGGGQNPPNLDDTIMICYSYWIDFEDDESCGPGCVAATQSILVWVCEIVGGNPGGSDPCDVNIEIIIVEPGPPCAGNPVKRPRLAPQTVTGKTGARLTDGNTRPIVRQGGTRAHNGTDIAMPVGTTVYNMMTAKVLYTHTNKSWGNHVMVEVTINGKAHWLLYAHLASNYGSKIIPGDTIQAGDIIGESALSGNIANAIKQNATVPHLHMELVEKQSTGNYNDWRKQGHTKDVESIMTTKFDSNGNVIPNTDC